MLAAFSEQLMTYVRSLNSDVTKVWRCFKDFPTKVLKWKSDLRCIYICDLAFNTCSCFVTNIDQYPDVCGELDVGCVLTTASPQGSSCCRLNVFH